MDINDLHPADDYTNRFFIWHEWIQANGLLTEENVFDYFATSMFYDKQSNNQVLRMQTMHTGVPIANEAEELRRFTGVEFAVVRAEPPTFFIIEKRERLSPDEVKPLAAYFIMNNRIYQSPDLYSLLSNRLLTSVSALQTSLSLLRKHRPDYTPRTGFVWPVAVDSTPGDAKKKNAETEVLATPDESSAPSDIAQAKRTTEGSKRTQNTMLLMNAMRTTAFNSKIASPTAAILAAESTTADTPATSQLRSSATPAPTAQEAMIKGTAGATSQESAKAAGKKKKKRASVVAPAVGPS